ncbi:MAG: DUF418 domain-containing protein [Acidobacteria bacterium]|nr:DUF418 domain-containing protein [Acidobacteriota bacterium]
MSTTTPVLAPVSAAERLEEVDLLRGWALLGILLVNMNFFAWPMFTIFLKRQWENPADLWAELAIGFFVQGKFYTLFSFLFGFGFSIFLLKGERQGRSALGVFARRLLVLMAIGVAHAFLIWSGDILLLYAMVGFLLFLFRKARPRTLLIWWCVLTLAPILLMGSGVVAASFLPEVAAKMQKDGAVQEAVLRSIVTEGLRVYPTGGFAQITRVRSLEVYTYYQFAAFFSPSVLAMFLLGLYAGKQGILHRVREHLPLFRKLRLYGFLLGMPLSAVAVWVWYHSNMLVPTPIGLLGGLTGALGAPLLGLGYASVWLLLYQDPKWKARLYPMTQMGRMALTHYLLQSLICTTVFYGTGFGLFGRYGPATTLPFVFVIYFAEMALSVWWLKRFQFGPGEWVWRSLTYGRLQPMRIAAATASQPLPAA